jgi:hypothetical protein
VVVGSQRVSDGTKCSWSSLRAIVDSVGLGAPGVVGNGYIGMACRSPPPPGCKHQRSHASKGEPLIGYGEWCSAMHKRSQA